MNTVKDNTITFAGDEPYRLLAGAVVLQAVKDSRKALKYDDETVKCECRRFFRSEWFKALTTIDGERLISELEAEVR